MTSRERFEDWHSRNYDTLPGTELHRVERAGMMKAWRVRDAEVATLQAEADAWRANARDSGVEARKYKAEVARLVEALHYAVSIIGHPDDAGTQMLVSLLREYTPKEKRDE